MMKYRTLIVLMTGLFAASAVVAENAGQRNPYPNEPEGYVPWFSHDWQTFPTGEDMGDAIWASDVGLVWVYGGIQNVELIDDPDAPHGKGKSLRHRQPRGQMGGAGHGGIDFFSPINREVDWRIGRNNVKLQSAYRSHWIKFEPHPELGGYQFGHTHLRTFWWNRATAGLTSALAEGGNVSITPPAGPAGQPHRHNDFRGASYWYSANDSQVHGRSTTIRHARERICQVGQWYHFEYLWETEGKFGPDEAGMNDSRLRIWIEGERVLDTEVRAFFRYPLMKDRFAMIWLGSGIEEVMRRPASDVSAGGWTNDADGATALNRSLLGEAANDATYVQSPLRPDGAALVIALDPIKDDGPQQSPPHASNVTDGHLEYRFAKNAEGGQAIDLKVEWLRRDDANQPWTVFGTEVHENIDAQFTDAVVTRGRFAGGMLTPGEYAVRFIASGGEGDARRVKVSWTRFRGRHVGLRHHDEHFRMGDIYISGVVYEQE